MKAARGLTKHRFLAKSFRVASNRGDLLRELEKDSRCPGVLPGRHEHLSREEASKFGKLYVSVGNDAEQI